MKETVAIIGASDNKEKYAYKAMQALLNQDHKIVLINKFKEKISGYKCYPSLEKYNGKIDTVTVYVSPEKLIDYLPQIKKINPKRVIMNPGTEDAKLEKELIEAGLKVDKACTLVLLSTKQF